MIAGVSDAVRQSVTVAVPVERAFAVFTEDITSWWPPEYHIGTQDMASAQIEPRSGGRWCERAADGSTCPWGDVVAYDPPYRLVLSWAITVEWQPEPDPSRASEIEVTFTAIDESTTRVDIEHRHFERHGPHGDVMRDAVGGEGGWVGILERYAAYATL